MAPHRGGPVLLRLLRAVAITAALTLAAAGIALAAGEIPEVLRVSAIPDENPSELARLHAPLADHLARELGMTVRFTPVVDYAATVEGLAAGKLDLVWLGGFTSVQAARRTGGTARRLVMREEDAEFRSVFVARPRSGVRSLADLRGKSFAFGSVLSTSGHLMPRYFLLQARVNPEKDFRQLAFSGAHDATALWVESGKVDAGALNHLVWDKLVQQKKVDPTRVAVFHTTPPYVDYVWTARGALDPGLRERIAAAFLRLDRANPAHRRLLELHRTRRYVRATDAEWRGIEEAAVAAGLLR